MYKRKKKQDQNKKVQMWRTKECIKHIFLIVLEDEAAVFADLPVCVWPHTAVWGRCDEGHSSGLEVITSTPWAACGCQFCLSCPELVADRQPSQMAQPVWLNLLISRLHWLRGGLKAGTSSETRFGSDVEHQLTGDFDKTQGFCFRLKNVFQKIFNATVFQSQSC